MSFRRATPALLALAVAAPAFPAARPDAPWVPDLGDGTYRNPVLFADYSDPDAIRVGDDFYLTSSSFLAAPGLPILHSTDLVNWTIINHVFAVQPPARHFARPRHGEGVWAPAIRHHAGKFWIYYPDPDFGIYVTTATDPAGAWSPPQLVRAGKGLIDPCPFWDDDGQAYLVHAWARSRSGISNVITLHRLDATGTRFTDAGVTIIDGAKFDGWHTIEGPKLYKRDGYYYIFAPAGGVTTGYQAVFRSRQIDGPYEARIVLDQGRTPVNGPHQGAWVDTPSGENWFLHFQDRGAFGRVVHLEPMTWRPDHWPVIGADPDGNGRGEPVLVHAKPNVRPAAIAVPATSDEFEASVLGLQWQWNANPHADWSSLTARPGFLRLVSQPEPATRNDGTPCAGNLYDAANLLLQKFPAPAFSVTTTLEFSPESDGESAGLIVFGTDYAWIGLWRSNGAVQVVQRTLLQANSPGASEQTSTSASLPATVVQLRVTVDSAGQCRFAYSRDGQTFTPLGSVFTATPDRWIGAKVGLFATTPAGAKVSGHADFDWVRFAATPPVSP